MAKNRARFSGNANYTQSVIPAVWEAKVGKSLEVRSLRPALPTWWNPFSTKNTKIEGRARWLKPVIPATQEAEAGELPELGRQRLRWAEIAPLHSSLGKEWNSVSKKKTKIMWARWWAPVILATWEAKAGESLEPTSWMLQWAKITPLYSSLGDRERLSQKK